jgi:hypothetical protein
MDFTSILQEISSWPVDDRVRLVQAVCDEMTDEAPVERIEDWEAEAAGCRIGSASGARRPLGRN